MQQAHLYLSILISYFHQITIRLEDYFLKITQKINFTLFCLIYSVTLVFLLKKLGQKSNFRPKNIELISCKKYYKEKLTRWIMNLPIIKQKTKKKIDEQFQKLDESLMIEFQKKRDPKKAFKLPSIGMNEDNLRRRINEWHSKQLKHIQTGKISGALYLFDQKYYNDISNFAAKYMYHNPLHMDTFKQLIRMQAQVLKMTASLVSNDPEQNANGVITSGGSQSLIMALYAYKSFYNNRTRPNIVVPNTIHAAVDKGCFYFNIQVRKARLLQNFQVDMKHLQSLIDKNTILIMGSYPNYPHGIIDPVEELARLGTKYNVGVHLDGCLGGFVAAFDEQHKKMFNIDRKGITSVSLDHHKFGLAPKGISTVFFKTKQLRHSMYYIRTDWCGGLYGTPSFCGSRNGFASAGAWYALTRNTKKTYKENTKIIIKATIQTCEKLKKIPGIRMFGEPKLCALAFASINTETSALDLCAYLNKEKGYEISPIHLPNGIHISMTMANCQKIRNQLANDIIEGFQFLKKNPPQQSASAAVYGATAKLPTSEVGDDLLKVIIGATLK